MKKVILTEQEENHPVASHNVLLRTPIFAKKEGVLCGMLVNEERGWILRTGGIFGAHGHHKTREACMKVAMQGGFEFFVE